MLIFTASELQIRKNGGSSVWASHLLPLRVIDFVESEICEARSKPDKKRHTWFASSCLLAMMQSEADQIIYSATRTKRTENP